MLTSYLALAGAIGAAAFFSGRFLLPRVHQRNLSRGRVDAPGGRKTQAAPVPFGGGTVLMAGVAIPLVLGFATALAATLGVVSLPESLAPYADGALSRWFPISALVVASVGLAAMGRVDDSRGLKVGPRLIIQFVLATLVVLSGIRASLFVDSFLLQLIVSVMWLVFATNAMNFIDNMDGLCVGSGLASALGIATLALLDGQVLVMALAISLAGALAAVLSWNRPPARLYLGDEGSQFAGFLLAALGLALSFQPEQSATRGFSFVPFFAPLLLMVIPVADGATVIVSRCRRGIPPWTAGLDHLSHRLARRLSSKTKAVAMLLSIAFWGAAGAVLVVNGSPPHLAAAALLAAVGAAVVIFLSTGPRRSRP
ncbi:MAG: MraY family glycosyltransferase [Planctomycetota bacterium]